jgi:TnpA family transposase
MRALWRPRAGLILPEDGGGGEVASADGLRFVVPIKTINARPNPKYFGIERGVTYYNFSSDQFSAFHGIVIPGTVRDSLYVLDGLLEQQTCLRPTEIITDTAGYADIVFGLFWLLGYQFSPRLADIGDARFWRTDSEADYGPLNGLSKGRIDTNLIAENWDDLLRRALDHLRSSDRTIAPEDEGRLSPLQHRHLNMQGRHQFILTEALKHGAFRPLRQLAYSTAP